MQFHGSERVKIQTPKCFRQVFDLPGKDIK